MDNDNRNMDIIERLEELRDLMKQKEDWFLLQVAKDEIELLRKERDGLREALTEIANYQKHGWVNGITDIARAALKDNS